MHVFPFFSYPLHARLPGNDRRPTRVVVRQCTRPARLFRVWQCAFASASSSVAFFPRLLFCFPAARSRDTYHIVLTGLLRLRRDVCVCRGIFICFPGQRCRRGFTTAVRHNTRKYYNTFQRAPIRFACSLRCRRPRIRVCRGSCDDDPTAC